MNIEYNKQKDTHMKKLFISSLLAIGLVSCGQSKQAAEKAAQEAAEIAALEAEDLLAKWKKAGKIGLVVGGVILVGYGIYKATPKVKAWWAEHRHHENEESEAA